MLILPVGLHVKAAASSRSVLHLYAVLFIRFPYYAR